MSVQGKSLLLTRLSIILPTVGDDLVLRKESEMLHLKEGAEVTLSAIQKKMLSAVTLPLPEDCPTGLRYALAKYSATAVAEAWEGLLALEAAGELENGC